MDDFSQRIASLTPEKLAFLRQQLAQKQARVDEPAIRPQRRARGSNSFPLSFAQQRLWFLAQLDPDTPAYNEIVVVQISGLLNVVALKHCLERLVERHEILRTVFTPLTRQGSAEPEQVILPSQPVSLPLVNLENATPEERQTAYDQLLIAQARHVFDLAQGPLWQTSLLKWSEQTHLLILNMHHMVTDGWSIGVLLRQTGYFYQAFVQQRTESRERPALQYADFAVWQREWLRDEVMEKQLTYWQAQLADPPSLLALPIDRPRPAIQTFRGSRESVNISKALTSALTALSRRENATLFMTLLAAFQTLLYRYTSQEDMVIGTAIANRNHKGIEDLIGFFVNTLALRTRCTGTMSFRELLAQVRETALEAYAHQDAPFEKIVEMLQPERSLNHNPLFQVMFVLHNTPLGALKIGDLELDILPTDTHTAKRDLSLAFTEGNDGLKGHIEYNTDLFEATTIARMIEHFLSLLNAIVTEPEQRLVNLTLLSQRERQLILETWNPPRCKEVRSQPIHQLFESQAQRTPDHPAIVIEQNQLTYRQLNQRANQLAHYLQASGITPETTIPLYMERSLESIIGLLAILKIGATYIPLDAMLPQRRLGLLLHEIAAPLCLTQSQLASVLPEGVTRVICLDQMEATLHEYSQSNPVLPQFSPDNLAYVIYTSGSTGKPKGVAIAHRQIHHYVEAIIERLDLSSCRSFALVSTFAADLGYTVLFPALVTGGTLHIITQERASDPAALADYLHRHPIDCLKIVPSHLHVLMAHSRAADIIPQRYLISGGESCSWDLVEKIQLLAPQCQLFNHYGPTETTVGVLTYAIPTRRPAHTTSSIPLGHPLTDTRVYILGQHMELLPVGVTGQLFIGGAGVARAYLHDPERTAENFVPNPFNLEAESINTRLYKTGDLGYYHEDGTIAFVGRVDQQIKVRGYRIEPGEIESVLRQQTALKEVLVSLVRNARGENRLVAYLVPDLAAEGEHIDDSDKAISAEQVSQWQMVFEDSYKQNVAQITPTFNLTGWNSSYTGQLIPENEMKEWIQNTTERILLLQPRHVLEIGCGAGLILFSVAPHVQQYHATDFSTTVIQNLQAVLSRLAEPFPQVTLGTGNASDLTAIKTGMFDCIVLNSVVQYFPGLKFFVNVLEQAIRALDGNGTIFIGDVRHYGLLEAFHLSVELANAQSTTPLSHIRQVVYKRISQEQELCIDPAFFTVLSHLLPENSRCQLQLKRGRARNELVRFRYDVAIHLGGENSRGVPEGERLQLDWETAHLDKTVIRQLLEEQQPPVLEINHIPNERLLKDIQAVELLHQDQSLTTVAELQAALQELDSNGIDPEDFWSIGQILPYTVEISWSGQSKLSQYSVRFEHQESQRTPAPTPSSRTSNSFARNWESYANNPLQGQFARKLIPRLRQILQETLPHYMLPATFLLLEKLPRTASGKINYKLLPTPDRTRPEIEKSYVAPRNPIEQLLASIYGQILDIEQIGIHDNFFEAGGHSLSATQVITQIRETFRIDIPLRAMFEAPTVSGLSDLLVKHETQPEQALSIARLRLKIKNMSADEVREMLNQRKTPSSRDHKGRK